MKPQPQESALLAALRAEHFERDRPLFKCPPPMLDVGTRTSWNAQAREDRSMFVIARHLIGLTEFNFRYMIEDSVTLSDSEFLLNRVREGQHRYSLAHATLKTAEPIVQRMVKELQQ